MLSPAAKLPSLSRGSSLVKRASPKLKQVFFFLRAQAVIQLLTAIFGFACIRLLSINDYAQYSIFYGLTSAIGSLTDMGLTGTLAGLIGERVHDDQVVADYLQVIRFLRRSLFWICLPGIIVGIPLLVRSQHWSFQTIALVELGVIGSVWLSGVSSVYAAAPLLRKDRNYYYRVQITSAALRLAGLLILRLIGLMSAYSIIGVNLLALLVTAMSFYRRSRKLLNVRGHATKALRKEAINLALPNTPSAFFYALQGQITIFVITVFGHTTGIASVGALGRIGQLFGMLGQTNQVLVEPYFAKMPAVQFKRKYLLTLLLAVIALVALPLMTLAWPTPLLLLLGSKYSHLRVEIVLTVAASGFSYVSGLLYSIHLARRFAFWWTSWLNIALILAAQVLFAAFSDLSNIRNVITLGLVTSAVTTVSCLFAGAHGLSSGPRKISMLPVSS